MNIQQHLILWNTDGFLLTHDEAELYSHAQPLLIQFNGLCIGHSRFWADSSICCHSSRSKTFPCSWNYWWSVPWTGCTTCSGKHDGRNPFGECILHTFVVVCTSFFISGTSHSSFIDHGSEIKLMETILSVLPVYFDEILRIAKYYCMPQKQKKLKNSDYHAILITCLIDVCAVVSSCHVPLFLVIILRCSLPKDKGSLRVMLRLSGH